MKLNLLDKLMCTFCRKGFLHYVGESKYNHEDILEGEIECEECGKVFPIHDGILMFDISNSEALREMSQWEVFAGSEGWLAKNELYLESLPAAGSNVLMKNDTISWIQHEYSFFNIIKSLDLENKVILDLGSGRGWSSKWITLLGGTVVAYDALVHPTIGLGAASVFFKNHKIYFERVQGIFEILPFRDQVFDIVFSSGSIHHSYDIKQTINEISRVVKPGGIVAFANEMASNFYTKNEKCNMTGNQEGINEHTYRMTKLLSLFRTNKLKIVDIRESMNVYDKRTIYYQGIFGSAINATKWGSLLYVIIRGGLYNCILKKSK